MNPAPWWTHTPSRSETLKVVASALLAAFLVGAIFSLFPALDIAVSGWFRNGDGGFALAASPFWRFLRRAFMNAFTVWYIVIAVACVATWEWRRTVLGFEFRKWFYLALCALAGPLLLVNIILKEQWGRWRPHAVTDLGGAEVFTRPLDWGGSCLDNCSFVSGEVASMVMVFVSLAFVTTAWRPVHYGFAVILGAVSALIRVGQGGHFLSDTLFAAILMVLVAAAIYWPMFLVSRR